MGKVLEFKRKDYGKLIEEFELEGIDPDLLDLAQVLANLNPAAKRGEAQKKTAIELTDDELDQAAGGLGQLPDWEKPKDPILE